MERHISLAIPYYNNSQYIMDALRVAITDNRVSEIIICDDDSKDILDLAITLPFGNLIKEATEPSSLFEIDFIW